MERSIGLDVSDEHIKIDNGSAQPSVCPSSGSLLGVLNTRHVEISAVGRDHHPCVVCHENAVGRRLKASVAYTLVLYFVRCCCQTKQQPRLIALSQAGHTGIQCLATCGCYPPLHDRGGTAGFALQFCQRPRTLGIEAHWEDTTHQNAFFEVQQGIGNGVGL